ncbi:MAG: hypothetical protein U5K54_05070 [Cytophagales bacterium]|nr:hypothetical protein [Cytophagales bacterium]
MRYWSMYCDSLSCLSLLPGWSPSVLGVPAIQNGWHGLVLWSYYPSCSLPIFFCATPGKYLVPSAMNVTHFVVFLLSLITQYQYKEMKTRFKIFLSITVVLVAAIGFVGYYFYKDTQDPYVQACDYSVPAEVIPMFVEAPVNFTHQFDDTKSLPMMAAAVLDINNDGVDELFIGGGNNQPDALFQFTNGLFN